MILESRELLVPDGAAMIFRVRRAPFSVAVHPEVGATASVEVAAASPSAVETGDPSIRWISLEAGLSAATLVTFPGPVTGLRLSSTGADTVFEVVQ